MGFGALLCVVCVLKQAVADLRMAGTPRKSFACEWGNGNRNTKCGGRYVRENGRLDYRLGPFLPSPKTIPGTYNAPDTAADIHHSWWEPSTFNYTGLGKIKTRNISGHPDIGHPESVNGGQKNNNYDQFLRSNIDNEQDNRNFDNEEGRDHLPFRTWSATESYRHLHIFIPKAGHNSRHLGEIRGYDTSRTMKPGDSLIVPLRWNNPHSSELEVNLWIFDHGGRDPSSRPGDPQRPIVVPIRKPTCSGEGYQNNVIKFTIPKDFAELGSKIPGFKGCNENSSPFCALQIYSHSVESRTYASAFPIFVLGSNKTVLKPSKPSSVPDRGSSIESSKEDPLLDITQLRDLCRPNNCEDAEIPNAVPRWARLVSDVYNHAYMNSDYSPYHGQQHDEISQNLQASAINKMVTGNRGELGKSITPSATYQRLRQLQLLEDRIYKNYETLANTIIEKVAAKQLKNTGDRRSKEQTRDKHGKIVPNGTPYGTAFLANCFRCAETGSMLAQRLTTNTYIPSFQMPTWMIKQANKLVPSQYDNLINSDGMVRIYVQTLKDLLPFYQASQVYGIIYQPAMLKGTVDTMADITDFKKRDADGQTDKGVYAATAAKVAFAKKLGCDHRCIKGETTSSCGGRKGQPLILGSAATCMAGKCEKCEKMFILLQHDPFEVAPLTKLALGIIAHGRPHVVGAAGAGVKAYPDSDGSPRFGRPGGVGGIIVPTPEPQVTWSSDITPRDPSTDTGARRRRSGGGRRRRRSAGGGGGSRTRRRSPRRRAKSVRRRSKSAALEQLFQEVRSQRSGMDKLA